MKLQDIFDQLSTGEFSQLSIGGAAAGVIDESNHRQVMNHITLGLTALYTRFNLKERRLTFPLQENADTYQLNVDDILKIERVLTDSDFEMVLNQEGDQYSCFTPSLHSIRVPQSVVSQKADLPEELKTDGLTICYRANHPKILATFLINPQNKAIELPHSHLEALLYFVASRVHNPIGMSNEFHAGNSYYAKYEAVCLGLENKGMQVNQETHNHRLKRNGWV